MGKIMYGMILMFAIELALVLFAKAAFPGSSLYNLMINPAGWQSEIFLDYLIGDILLIAGTVGIVAGLYFIRNEWIVYAGVGAVFISFGINLYNMWQFISAQGIFGDSGAIVGTILVSGLLISYIVTVLDFTRGRD